MDVSAGQWRSAGHALPFLYSLLTTSPILPSTAFLTHLSLFSHITCFCLHFPWPSLPPHFHYLLHHTLMISWILPELTMLSLLPDTYSGLLSRQIFLHVRSSSRMARNAGGQTTPTCWCQLCQRLCSSWSCLHTPAASTALSAWSVPGKKLCLGMGCGT